jgi:hypothetical protein
LRYLLFNILTRIELFPRRRILPINPDCSVIPDCNMAKRKSGLLQAFAQVLGKPPKKSRKKSHKKSKPASDSGKSESPDEPAAKSKGKAPPKEEVGEPSTAPPKEKSEKEKKMDALKAKKKGLKSQLETTEGKIRQTEKQYCDNEMKFIN